MLCYRLGKLMFFHFWMILESKNRNFRENCKQMMPQSVTLFAKEMLMI